MDYQSKEISYPFNEISDDTFLNGAAYTILKHTTQ